MQTDSVSQGVFFHLPARSKSQKNGMKPKLVADIAAKYFEGFGPPVSTAEIRWRFYRYLLQKHKENCLKLQESWYEGFVTAVVKFIKISEKSLMSNNQEATTPLAFLATGLPKDENKILLDKIVLRVRKLTPHVTILSSRTYGNVKNAFQIVCKQLMQQQTCDNIPDDTVSELSDTDTEETCNVKSQTSKTVRSKLKFVSAHDLQHWYRDSPQKPVVVVIEDIDFFPLPVAQNLLMAFSCLKLPVIFIIGVTSCSQNFDNYVPRKCPTTFVYKTFHPIGPHDRLSDFINKIVLNPSGVLQLSGPVVRYLSNIFLHHEFSSTRLEQIIQLCMLEHFRKAKSVICADSTHLGEEFDNAQMDIDDVVKETFGIEASSLKLKISGASPRKIIPLPIVNVLKSHITTFHTRRLEWYAFLKFLHAIIIQKLRSFGDTLADLYIMCWNGDIFKEGNDYEEQTSIFQCIISSFTVMSREQLEAQLVRGAKELEQFLANYDCTETKNPTLLTRVQHFIQNLQKVEEQDKKLQEERESKVAKDGRPLKMPTPKSQTEFVRIMRERAMQPEKKSVYEPLRTEFVRWLAEQIKEMFQNPLDQLPLGEAFIFNDLNFVQEIVTPNSQKRIHVALTEPSAYLPSESTNDSIQVLADEDKTDVSIVYRLFLEQQIQNINVNIIFESFKSYVEIIPPNRKRLSVASNAKGNSALAQSYLIRFRQAIAELQHMGFLKRSTKVDEVSKQTFGF